ncbi:DNA-binding transcriptional activator GcvA [compost metagenome]
MTGDNRPGSGSVTSNDNEALLAAARTGLGILAGGEWLMQHDIDAGTLVRVLPEWQLDAEAGIYLVRPSSRFGTATSNAFKHWIEESFADGAPWRSP